MTFVLIRIILSLFPFVKEAFFDYQSKKTPLNFGVLIALIAMVAVFFLQADVIKKIYLQNQELLNTVKKNTIIIADLKSEAALTNMNYNGELNSLKAIISTQAHFLTLCTKPKEE